MGRAVIDKDNPHSGDMTLGSTASLLVIRGLRRITLECSGADATWARAVGDSAATPDGGTMPTKTSPLRVGDVKVIESHGKVPYDWTILLAGSGATATANAER